MHRSSQRLLALRILLMGLSLGFAFVLAIVSGGALPVLIVASSAFFVIFSILFRVQSYLATFLVSAGTSLLVPLVAIALLSGMDHRGEQTRRSNPSSSPLVQLFEMQSTYIAIPFSIGLHVWFLFVIGSVTQRKS
jgi:hypothetical protein